MILCILCVAYSIIVCSKHWPCPTTTPCPALTLRPLHLLCLCCRSVSARSCKCAGHVRDVPILHVAICRKQKYLRQGCQATDTQLPLSTLCPCEGDPAWSTVFAKFEICSSTSPGRKEHEDEHGMPMPDTRYVVLTWWPGRQKPNKKVSRQLGTTSKAADSHELEDPRGPWSRLKVDDESPSRRPTPHEDY